MIGTVETTMTAILTDCSGGWMNSGSMLFMSPAEPLDRMISSRSSTCSGHFSLALFM